MTAFLVVLYVLVCIFLILVVLLQQGKGADLAGAFGGGGSQTSFGPRTSTNIMHRFTTVSFVLFVVLSMALAILSGKRHASVVEDIVSATPTPVAERGSDEETVGAPQDASGSAPSTVEEPAPTP